MTSICVTLSGRRMEDLLIHAVAFGKNVNDHVPEAMLRSPTALSNVAACR
ncbi:hypothetical protein NDU88_001575, partial [Pleurodeles waltl]